ncbi:hypothetical protein [Streptomyces pilosus]|uniref:hypothetical protein n=1 Tax=Streptomyces pilosus TaxID=28893 RepID=UPI00370033A8
MNTLTAVEALEQRLGDPFDPANPHGFDALLAAAEARRPPDPEPWRVPSGAPEPVLHALRAVCRRSPALARTPGTGAADEALAVGARAGALDSALRITLRHLRGRRLYGAAAADLPVLRSVLSGAFADLLLCDALTTLAVRGTDALPDRPDATAHAVTAFVPRVLQGALDRLSVVMGSRFYIREGDHASFQRLLHETQRALFGAGRRTPERDPAAPFPLDALLAAPAVTGLYDPALLAAAPGRALNGRARRTPQPTGSAHERLYADLVDRHEANLALDLTRRPLPDRP